MLAPWNKRVSRQKGMTRIVFCSSWYGVAAVALAPVLHAFKVTKLHWAIATDIQFD